MAYVIAVVGAGGKSTYIKNRATDFLSEKKSVAITTTTHIWDEDLLFDGFPVFGTKTEDGKLSYPGDDCYQSICMKYDYVLVESDGSKSMPVKIPRDYEPVIPPNVDEIIVVMGEQAIGRNLKDVCQNSNVFYNAHNNLFGNEDVDVTKELLSQIAHDYYISPLSKKYPNAKIQYIHTKKGDISKISDKKILLAILASGFSRRFNGNKLLSVYKDKALYRHMLDSLQKVEAEYPGVFRVLVVSQYEEILDAGKHSLNNNNAIEGISASIKLSTEYAIENNFDYISFFLADMPNLTAKDILLFLECFLFSNKETGCMCTNQSLSNPGILKLTDENKMALLSLRGEEGAMKIISKDPKKRYLHYVGEKKLFDVDLRGDA